MNTRRGWRITPGDKQVFVSPGLYVRTFALRKLVSSLLGHSTIKQTLDTYSHVLDNMLGSVADGMDNVLSDARPLRRSISSSERLSDCR